jgi:environmental stress-induced protein Ves
VRITHLRESDYRRQRWKNGGGWTTELAVSPSDGDFDWRVSIAEIESDGAFSTFPHCDRHIALLDGNGMRLEFDAAQPVLLDRRLHFVAFAGEWRTFGALIDGPVRDFNVIARRERVQADVLHRPLVGTMVFPPLATWFVYLAAGRATLKHRNENTTLEAGDSLLLEPDAAADNAILDGGGELVLVKFSSRESQASTA